MEEFTADQLIDMAAAHKGGFVWIMSEEYYQRLRFHGPKDDNGRPLFIRHELSGYGTLLGHKIALVDFDHFGIAAI